VPRSLLQRTGRRNSHLRITVRPAHRHGVNAAIAKKGDRLNGSKIASKNQDFPRVQTVQCIGGITRRSGVYMRIQDATELAMRTTSRVMVSHLGLHDVQFSADLLDAEEELKSIRDRLHIAIGGHAHDARLCFIPENASAFSNTSDRRDPGRKQSTIQNSHVAAQACAHYCPE
jgi:hypothetical protein